MKKAREKEEKKALKRRAEEEEGERAVKKGSAGAGSSDDHLRGKKRPAEDELGEESESAEGEIEVRGSEGGWARTVVDE